MSNLINYDNSGLQVVSPTPSGAGGKALNRNFQLLAYQRRIQPTNVSVASFTIPAISSNTRQVVTVTLGTLKNPVQAIVGFFSSDIADSSIQALTVDGEDYSLDGCVQIICTPILDALTIVPALLSPFISSRMMIVTSDYTAAMRCSPPATPEQFEGGMGYGYTYAALNVGALFGFYSGVGVLQLDKNIQMESAWLTLSGTQSVLNMAFYNYDVSGANTALPLKVGVYE